MVYWLFWWCLGQSQNKPFLNHWKLATFWAWVKILLIIPNKGRSFSEWNGISVLAQFLCILLISLPCCFWGWGDPPITVWRVNWKSTVELENSWKSLCLPLEAIVLSNLVCWRYSWHSSDCTQNFTVKRQQCRNAQSIYNKINIRSQSGKSRRLWSHKTPSTSAGLRQERKAFCLFYRLIFWGGWWMSKGGEIV